MTLTTSDLDKIEQLRKELLNKIIEITGLDMSNIDVDVMITSNHISNIAAMSNWKHHEYNDSEWYESNPQNDDTGSVSIFAE